MYLKTIQVMKVKFNLLYRPFVDNDFFLSLLY